MTQNTKTLNRPSIKIKTDILINEIKLLYEIGSKS